MDIGKKASDVEEKVRHIVEDPEAVSRVAQSAQEKVKRHKGVLGVVVKDLETLIRMVRAWASGKYKGISLANILIALGAVFYFLMPIDAIADFLPLIGFSDDVAVVMYAVRRLKDEFDRFEDWEQTVDVAFGKREEN